MLGSLGEFTDVHIGHRTGFYSIIFIIFILFISFFKLVRHDIPDTTAWSFLPPFPFPQVSTHVLTITMAVAWRLHTVGLASQERIFSRVSGSLSATRPPQTSAAKARKMGMILVMPMKAAKMKLAMMAANLLMPLRMPNAVPLQREEEG